MCDRKAGGWHYNPSRAEDPFELPGLWFNASNLYALLAAHQLLSRVEPGLIAEDTAPLIERIEGIEGILCIWRMGSGETLEKLPSPRTTSYRSAVATLALLALTIRIS